MESAGVVAPGTVLGDWVVERLLGSGGMAEVYLARFPRLQRLDVLKVMRPMLAGDPDFRRRFAAEAQLMCDWRHPHVVTVYDHRQQGDLLYIAMQYVAQGDLRQVMLREGPMPYGRALAVVGQVADALDSGHERGLVHRDVKPENVLVERWQPGRDHVLLSDFGISRSTASQTRLTQTGQAVFSPLYAAPEQWAGDDVSGATDQYALACLTFELLTGSAPFRASNPSALARAHLVDPPPPLPPGLRLPPQVDAVFARALAKDPAQRFPNCSAFVEALVTSAAGGSGPRTTIPAGSRTQRDNDRRPGPSRLLVAAVAAAVVVSLAVVAGVFALGGDDPEPAAAEAPAATTTTPPTRVEVPAGPGTSSGTGSGDGTSSDTSSSGTTSSATMSTAARALADRFATTHRDCVEVPVADATQVASVRCQAVDPGVDLLTITQFRSSPDVRRALDAVIADERLAEGACSGADPAWQSWSYSDEQTDRGRFACYRDDRERAMLQWSFDADRLLLTAVRGDGDLALANAWWGS